MQPCYMYMYLVRAVTIHRLQPTFVTFEPLHQAPDTQVYEHIGGQKRGLLNVAVQIHARSYTLFQSEKDYGKASIVIKTNDGDLFAEWSESGAKR